MTKLLCDIKDELIKKYGYDDELAEALSITIDSLSDYFSMDNSGLIYEAVSSCEYKLAYRKKVGSIEAKQTAYDVLKEMGLNPNEDFKNYLDAYYSENQKRVIVLPCYFNFESPSCNAILVKNTLKVVFSHIREFVNISGKNKRREGIGIYGSNPNESCGYGLEEGIISYCTQEIIRTEYGMDYDEQGLDYQRITAGFLMETMGLKDDLIASCITGTDNLSHIFENYNLNYDDFIRVLDEISLLEQERKGKVSDSNLLDEATERLNRTFEEKVVPFVRGFNTVVMLPPELAVGYTV